MKNIIEVAEHDGFLTTSHADSANSNEWFGRCRSRNKAYIKVTHERGHGPAKVELDLVTTNYKLTPEGMERVEAILSVSGRRGAERISGSDCAILRGVSVGAARQLAHELIQFAETPGMTRRLGSLEAA